MDPKALELTYNSFISHVREERLLFCFLKSGITRKEHTQRHDNGQEVPFPDHVSNY